MAGLGQGRIVAPGDVNKSAIWDVVVDSAGSGDYLTISEACDGTAADTIIAVAPNDITEIADIDMKSGQIVFALGGLGGDQVQVDMGVGFEWIMAGDNWVNGLKVITSSTSAVTPLFDMNGTDIVIENVEVDATSLAVNNKTIFESLSDRAHLRDILLTSVSTQNVRLVRLDGDDSDVEGFRASAILGPTSGQLFALNGDDSWARDIYIDYANVAQPAFPCFGCNTASNATFDNCNIVGSTVDNDVQGFAFDTTGNCKIDNSTVHRIGTGITLDFCSRTLVSNVEIGLNTDEGILISSAGGAETQYNKFVNVSIKSDGAAAADIGIEITGADASYNEFVNCSVTMSNGDCVQIDTASTEGVKFTNCRFEESGAGNLFDLLSTRTIFTNCSFSGTAAATQVGNVGLRIDNCDGFDWSNLTDNGTYTIIESYYSEGAAPDVNDDVSLGFQRGDTFGDTSTGIDYLCTSNANGAAAWSAIGAGAGGWTYVTKTEADSPYSISSDEALDNIGAGAALTVTLPAAARGAAVKINLLVAQNVIVTAAAGDIIQIGGAASSAAGTATANSLGDSIELVCLDSTYWVAQAVSGTWVLA